MDILEVLLEQAIGQILPVFRISVPLPERGAGRDVCICGRLIELGNEFFLF